MYHKKTYLLSFLLILITITTISCSSKVAFQSLDAPDGITYQNLTGYLIKPEGPGPFPAIVMLHHCSGLDNEGFFQWARQLKRLGYVSFLVDSFGPRHITNVCNNGAPTVRVRASDAHAAKLNLSGLSFVDPERIAVMGWSHGALGAVLAIQDPEHKFPGKPFKAAVAYYPYCTSLFDLNAPLLILIGAEDDWTPAGLCQTRLPSNSPHDIILKIYPETHHGFFFPVRSQIYYGHRIGYSPNATRDAKERTIKFLYKHLKE